MTLATFPLAIPSPPSPIAPRSALKISLLVWNLTTNDGAIRASLLSAALERLGYETEVLGFTFGEGVYPSLPSTLKVFAVPGGNFPEIWGSVRLLLDRLDGDVIYAIKPQLPSYGLALLNRWLSRWFNNRGHVPVILDIDDWEMSWHGGDSWRYRPSPKQFLRDLFQSNGALRQPGHPLYIRALEARSHWADAVTVHTQFLQERFGGFSVPNGKDIDRFDPDRYDPATCRATLGLSDYRLLMFPGAPRPYKGVEDVLAALEMLDEPDLRLAIVGGSPYDNYDQELRDRWGKWLIQIPRQSADTMPAVVSAAHVVVVPQRDDPATRAQFPLKITDGMALAKPVLAARVGDVPLILGDTGYLVDPSSPAQIADRIREIFGDYDAALAQGRRARDRCIEHYSLAAMQTALVEVLASIGVLSPSLEPASAALSGPSSGQPSVTSVLHKG
jgi:glycosyltransferase involved in cell wall biosynthesis